MPIYFAELRAHEAHSHSKYIYTQHNKTNSHNIAPVKEYNKFIPVRVSSTRGLCETQSCPIDRCLRQIHIASQKLTKTALFTRTLTNNNTTHDKKKTKLFLVEIFFCFALASHELAKRKTFAPRKLLVWHSPRTNSKRKRAVERERERKQISVRIIWSVCLIYSSIYICGIIETLPTTSRPPEVQFSLYLLRDFAIVSLKATGANTTHRKTALELIGIELNLCAHHVKLSVYYGSI